MKVKNKAVLKYLKTDDSQEHLSDKNIDKKNNKNAYDNTKKVQKKPSSEPNKKYVVNTKRKVISPTKKKLLNNLIVFITFLVLLSIGVTLSLTVFFKIENITVDCSADYDTKKIIEQSQIVYGENLFLCDRKRASSEIVRQNPYIEKAEVSIKIPNRINISVKKAVPAYYILFNKKYFVLSKSNRILEINDKKIYNIPIIEGVEIKDSKEGSYLKIGDKNLENVLKNLLTSLEENRLNDIIGIDVNMLFNIKLNYQNRIQINIGAAENIDYKIKTAKKIIGDELDSSVKGILDVSLADKSGKQSSFLQDNNIFN